MKVVAILFRSTGNESVGEMWRETKVFDDMTSVGEILKWASGSYPVKNFRSHLEITIDQSSIEEETTK